jgi:hypothetical protein
MRGISWLAAKPVSFSRRTLLHGVSKKASTKSNSLSLIFWSRRWRLIFVGPQCVTCLTSHLCSPKFCGRSRVFYFILYIPIGRTVVQGYVMVRRKKTYTVTEGRECQDIIIIIIIIIIITIIINVRTAALFNLNTYVTSIAQNNVQNASDFSKLFICPTCCETTVLRSHFAL